MFKRNINKGKPSAGLNVDKLKEAKDNLVKKKKDFKLKHFKLYIAITVAILAVLAIVFAISSYVDNSRYNPYYKYEEKMKIYGFDKLYNNKTATTNEYVTTSEALKLAIAAAYNISDLSGIAEENTQYENATWVDYAKDLKITDEDINISNYNNRVKYLDVIKYFENAKIKLVKNTEIKDVTANLKDMNKYKPDQQVVIKDMIANNIISINNDKLNGNEYIFKGQLNEIIVNFVEKYNTITILGGKLNINPEKMPSNVNEYPYTLTDVDKSVYEIKNYDADSTGIKLPRDIFSYEKESYYQINDIVTKYLNTLLNVDYENLNKTEFKENMNSISLFGISDSKYEEYFKYVESNKIKVSGTAKVQFPAIYYDGMVYRVRTKVEYEIKSSNNYENIFFNDNNSLKPVAYDKGKKELILDIPISVYYNTPQFAVYISRLNDYIAGSIGINLNEGLEIDPGEPKGAIDDAK